MQFQPSPRKRYHGLPKNLRWRVIHRDGHRCVRCGTQKHLSVHHLLSRGAGGSNLMENLQTLCKPCHFHLEKGRPHPEPERLCIVNLDTASATERFVIRARLKEQQPAPATWTLAEKYAEMTQRESQDSCSTLANFNLQLSILT